MSWKSMIKKKYGLSIREDRYGNGYWITTKGFGSGNEFSPHVHDTFHINDNGDILSGHTTITVNGKTKRFGW